MIRLKLKTTVINILLMLPLLLCWGSFLNVVAFRLLSGESLFDPHSRCTHCKTVLAWYDLIPVLSWLLLQGKCRYCGQSISGLYPFIELLTALLFFLLLMYTPFNYWFGYSLLFTAFIVVTRTDLQEYLIPQYFTIYFIPIGLILSYYHLLPITFIESMIGSLSAYLFLWLFATVYYLITKRIGIGQGDIDLLALIGAFTGFIGWWFSLTVAAIAASIIGVFLLCFKKMHRTTKLPFGPFLALGSIIYILFQQNIFHYMLKMV